MFERKFTKKAAEAIAFSEQAAFQLGHNYVGSEHILIGICEASGGTVSEILSNNSVTAEAVTGRIEELIGRGMAQPKITGFTPRGKRILEMSFEIAVSLGHSYIGTEHILLAILQDKDSVAYEIISELSGNADKLRDGILAIFNQGNGGASAREDKKSGEADGPEFGIDLTAKAAEGKIDPVIGRDEEIQRIIEILSRRTKNNPCLIGEPGVGKTAVIEGLARRIVEGKVPENLKDKKIVTVDISSMIAGSKYRGEFEERLKNMLSEVKKNQDTVLFIDEVHTIVGAGAAEGAVDAANILKPSLARGEIQLIGATTLEEYRKYIEKDAALERRFQPVNVDEPTVEETVEILKGLRDKYEAHHKIKISDDAIEAAAKLSNRYITDRFLPDKALDLVDEASSKARIKNMTAPPEVKDIEEKIEKLRAEKEAAVTAQDYEQAAKLRDEENEAVKALEERKKDWDKKNSSAVTEIDGEDIAAVVSAWTKIPVSRLTDEEGERLLKLEETLHGRVIGQDEAVAAVSRAIRRSRAGLKDPKRPIGSFLFLGPTGVGKTELSKALAEAMFGNEDSLIRIDMSEYMEKHSVSKLIGSPPGYVGYDDGGQLTKRVRRNPYCVILFDEIEKAHPDVFNAMLQILDDGVLTDSQGRRVDFKNTVIIMTSNVGARMITETQRKLGFGNTEEKPDGDYEAVKERVMGELKAQFRPEFINRIDDITVFHRLTLEDTVKISEILLAGLVKRVSERGIEVQVEPSAYEYLAKKGFDASYGARPLKRTIQTEVEDMLSEEILKGSVKPGDKIRVYADEEGVKVTAEP